MANHWKYLRQDRAFYNSNEFWVYFVPLAEKDILASLEIQRGKDYLGSLALHDDGSVRYLGDFYLLEDASLFEEIIRAKGLSRKDHSKLANLLEGFECEKALCSYIY